MYHNGTINKHVRYSDLCTEESNVHIAYNNFPFFFEIVNNTMVDNYESYIGHLHKDELPSAIPYDHEILSVFLKQNHITPKWINCNGTLGSYNQTMNQWTGAIGQVNYCQLSFA